MVNKNRFAEALALQDACNPSGVALTLTEMFRQISEEGGGTADKCADPAIRVAVMKLADLCGIDVEGDLEAYRACEERAS